MATLIVEDEVLAQLENLANVKKQTVNNYATAVLRRHMQEESDRFALLSASLPEIEAFLDRRQAEGDIDESAKRNAGYFLRALIDVHPLVVKPDVAPGDERGVLAWWDDRQHHLELEIFSDRAAEWFYRDRESEATWEQRWEIEDPAMPAMFSNFISYWFTRHA